MAAVRLVEVGLIVRAASVDIVEIELRISKVDECIRIVLLHQRTGRIERQVVIDELAEIRVAGGDALVLFVIDLRFRSRLRFGFGDHESGERVQCVSRKDRRAQSSEHAAEPTLEQR